MVFVSQQLHARSPKFCDIPAALERLFISLVVAGYFAKTSGCIVFPIQGIAKDSLLDYWLQKASTSSQMLELVQFNTI
ncbi:10306_t:CDS:2 [Funneliformis geosporum]|uniref:10306_t:CDS:1 n=1 Tax=Funneliformis geosporum TaxID=1117311 RepID=A0A9W4SP62_9GLOM|nr:10306_t:CDS:2 [Funneliformis geosporum]